VVASNEMEVMLMIEGFLLQLVVMLFSALVVVSIIAITLIIVLAYILSKSE